MTTAEAMIWSSRAGGSVAACFSGTGKFPSNAALRAAIDASGTEMVTVALRRIDPTAEEDILDAMPSTGCCS